MRNGARAIRIDVPLIVTALLLCLGGLAVVWSASSVLAIDRFGTPNAYFSRQLMFFGVGLVACFGLANVPYTRWQEPLVTWGLALSALGGLLAVFAFPARNGAHRWLKLPGLSAQPSDLAKLALIILVANLLADTQRPGGGVGRGIGSGRIDWRLVRVIAVCGAALALILAEPDLGTAVILAGTLFLTLFLGGLAWSAILPGAGAGLLGLAAMIAFSPFRRARMLAFLHPELTSDGPGYQIAQAKLALGAGGFSGKWFMGGSLRLLYLPEPHTDCIFASLGEETGLIGTTLVLIGFLVLIARGYKIADDAATPFGQYLAFGLTTLLATQSFFNLLVVTGMAPAKGIALPFLSYGGSSLVISLAAVGILLNISQHRRGA